MNMNMAHNMSFCFIISIIIIITVEITSLSANKSNFNLNVAVYIIVILKSSMNELKKEREFVKHIESYLLGQHVKKAEILLTSYLLKIWKSLRNFTHV